jgi:hypothetical protein
MVGAGVWSLAHPIALRCGRNARRFFPSAKSGSATILTVFGGAAALIVWSILF